MCALGDYLPGGMEIENLSAVLPSTMYIKQGNVVKERGKSTAVPAVPAMCTCSSLYMPECFFRFFLFLCFFSARAFFCAPFLPALRFSSFSSRSFPPLFFSFRSFRCALFSCFPAGCGSCHGSPHVCRAPLAVCRIVSGRANSMGGSRPPASVSVLYNLLLCPDAHASRPDACENRETRH